MEISTIAVKQKRLKDWTRFVEREVSDPKIKGQISEHLRRFSDLLFRCFEKGEISQADAQLISNLEQQLESLNEEARLSVVPQNSLSRAADDSY